MLAASPRPCPFGHGQKTCCDLPPRHDRHFSASGLPTFAEGVSRLGQGVDLVRVVST